MVTGSAGGVGAWTVGALADADRKVVAVDREAPPTGEHRDAAETIETVHGYLPADGDLDGDDSVFDCSKAERPLGWEPTHSWRDEVANSGEGPHSSEDPG